MQFYYGAQSDGSVGLVHKFIWKGDAMEGDWYMDGKKTSGNMYETYYKKYCVVNNTYEPQDTTVYTGDGQSFDLHLEANEIRWYQI